MRTLSALDPDTSIILNAASEASALTTYSLAPDANNDKSAFLLEFEPPPPPLILITPCVASNTSNFFAGLSVPIPTLPSPLMRTFSTELPDPSEVKNLISLSLVPPRNSIFPPGLDAPP